MRTKKSGTTMVEVIVAVMIVSIVMTMFGKVVGASVQMYSRSIAIIRETEAFNADYYKATSIEGRAEVEAGLQLEDENGRKIPLPKAIVKKYTSSDENGGTKIVRYSIGVKPETESGADSE